MNECFTNCFKSLILSQTLSSSVKMELIDAFFAQYDKLESIAKDNFLNEPKCCIIEPEWLNIFAKIEFGSEEKTQHSQINILFRRIISIMNDIVLPKVTKLQANVTSLMILEMPLNNEKLIELQKYHDETKKLLLQCINQEAIEIYSNGRKKTITVGSLVLNSILQVLKVSISVNEKTDEVIKKIAKDALMFAIKNKEEILTAYVEKEGLKKMKTRKEIKDDILTLVFKEKPKRLKILEEKIKILECAFTKVFPQLEEHWKELFNCKKNHEIQFNLNNQHQNEEMHIDNN